METKDIIFIPTVQHTGTWFVLKFLENFIPVRREATAVLNSEEMINQPMVIHTHLPIPDSVEGSKCLPLEATKLMSRMFKTVIPLRDPLAAILTRECRHPELRHFYIVNGFNYIAKNLANNENVKFFPIDLPLDEAQRRGLLIDTMVHCGIDPDPHHDLICSTAKEWSPENETPGNRFRSMYKEKDIYQLKSLLGPKWAEVDHLKNNASIILPLLADNGYTKQDLNLW